MEAVIFLAARSTVRLSESLAVGKSFSLVLRSLVVMVTAQASVVILLLAPTSKGLSISPYVQRLTLHWTTLSTLLMMAHKAETAVQGWSVDPMEAVILTHRVLAARSTVWLSESLAVGKSFSLVLWSLVVMVTAQASVVILLLAPTSKGLSISPYVQRLTLHWITLSTLLMMAHKAETAVQGWSVDPMEAVILTHTHTHTHTHADRSWSLSCMIVSRSS